MKKLPLFLVVVLVVSYTNIGFAEPVFRDLSWGDPVESIGETIFLGEQGGGRWYEKQNEDLDFGAFSALRMGYQFANDKLVGIAVDINPVDIALVRTILMTKYGPGRPSEGEHQWETEEVYALLTYENPNNVSFMLYDTNFIMHLIRQLQESYETAW